MFSNDLFLSFILSSLFSSKYNNFFLKSSKLSCWKNKIPKLDNVSSVGEESIDESKKELDYKDIKIKKNVLNKKENVLECFRILSKLIDINFRADPIINYLEFLDKNKKKYAGPLPEIAVTLSNNFSFFIS